MGRQAVQADVVIETAGHRQTVLLGEECGRVAPSGLVISLDGQMGSGKTTFVSGLARGLRTPDDTQSPTFTLVAEYRGGRLPLYHVDLYRLGDQVTTELGMLDEYFFGDGVCAVEWADLLGDVLPTDRLEVRFAYGDDSLSDARLISLSAGGSESRRVLEEWMKLWQSLRSTPPHHP